ncbi:MAG: creatininase [Gammaproteobacteria bacterium]|nr:creatininase [Gammaproteobacteria bacterium]
MFKKICLSLLLLTTLPAHLIAQTPDTVFLEELTWTEVRDAIDDGTTTIIVPTAGTEQNGPHMVLGKHKYRINAGAERIARALENALVAPAMTYVPEGDIDPPSGHMRYAGTISIPIDVFASVLEHTARSLKQHGFTDILFIGDSGPNQRPQELIAEQLSNEWESIGVRVMHISNWYKVGVFDEYLLSQGSTYEQIGTHAGLRDTALLLAIAPEHVRTDSISKGRGPDVDGVSGDPTIATVELGQVGFDLIFNSAMDQIRELMELD